MKPINEQKYVTMNVICTKIIAGASETSAATVGERPFNSIRNISSHSRRKALLIASETSTATVEERLF